MRTNPIKVLKQFIFIGSVAVGVIAAGTRPAAATPPNPVTCTPTRIQYNDTSSYKMTTITCGGVNYYAQLSPGGNCTPATSIDGQRFYMTLAESALLSGKSLTISYTSCDNANGANFINSVDIVQ